MNLARLLKAGKLLVTEPSLVKSYVRGVIKIKRINLYFKFRAWLNRQMLSAITRAARAFVPGLTLQEKETQINTLGKKYFITNMLPVGLGVRSILFMDIQGRGMPSIITADVGNDALTVIPGAGNGRYGNRYTIQLPKHSAPISICPAGRDKNGRQGVFVACFNFDTTGRENQKSRLLYLSAHNLESGEGYYELLSRQGGWGYRNIVSMPGRGQNITLTTVDRTKGTLEIYNVTMSDSDRPAIIGAAKVDLNLPGRASEPISIGIIEQGNNSSPVYAVSQRNSLDLAFVDKDAAGLYRIRQRVNLAQGSRSSVAVGKFYGTAPDSGKGVAVALWGGDPRDLQSVRRGKVAVLRQLADGNYAEPVYIDAGVHTTDVVAGDLDGDGIDELAVLNYGADYGEQYCFNAGGVMIFKCVGDEWIKVADVPVPQPRIGTIADVDGDGQPELVTSLFFARKLAVIKAFYA